MNYLDISFSHKFLITKTGHNYDNFDYALQYITFSS
jgi:hypothetical protein